MDNVQINRDRYQMLGYTASALDKQCEIPNIRKRSYRTCEVAQTAKTRLTPSYHKLTSATGGLVIAAAPERRFTMRPGSHRHHRARASWLRAANLSREQAPGQGSPTDRPQGHREHRAMTWFVSYSVAITNCAIADARPDTGVVLYVMSGKEM